jgi:hypothetical protein
MRISDSFKLFNPLWLVQNIFTTHLQPMLIGAGVGALSSAAMGKSPFTGALLGGATGGMFGGSESLLGGKIADAFGTAATSNVAGGVKLAEMGTGAAGGGAGINIAPFVKEAGTGFTSNALPSATTTTGAYAGGIPISTGDLASGGGANMSRLFNYTPPTAWEKIQGAGTDAYTWAKDNPLSAGNIGLKGFELANQPPKPVDTSAQRPVKQGTYEGGTGVQLTPTPAATGVSPQILPAKPNKTGQIALDSVMQRHPELIQLYPNLFGGR